LFEKFDRYDYTTRLSACLEVNDFGMCFASAYAKITAFPDACILLKGALQVLTFTPSNAIIINAVWV